MRDLIDLMGEAAEQIDFFCIHDADASGTLIYQALQEGTDARAARTVRIHNLGLEPWEALEMDLQVENFTTKAKKLPVAAYVEKQFLRGFVGEQRAPDGSSWPEWLQSHRVELNAMSSRVFLRWLTEKMKPFSRGKVVPPEHVLRETLFTETEAVIRQRLIDEAVRWYRVDEKLTDTLGKVSEVVDAIPAEELEGTVTEGLTAAPESLWKDPVRRRAEALAGSTA